MESSVLGVLTAVIPQETREGGPGQAAVHLVDGDGQSGGTIARVLSHAHYGLLGENRMVHLSRVLSVIYPGLGIVAEVLETFINGELEDVRVGHVRGEVGRLAPEVHHV